MPARHKTGYGTHSTLDHTLLRTITAHCQTLLLGCKILAAKQQCRNRSTAGLYMQIKVMPAPVLQRPVLLHVTKLALQLWLRQLHLYLSSLAPHLLAPGPGHMLMT